MHGETFGYILVGLFVVSFAMVARRLETSIVTAPMAFIALGAMAHYFGFLPHAANEELLHLVAEITLVVLLFLDAAKVDAFKLRHERAWPIRMLLIGLPLALVLGAVVGMALFPDKPVAAVILVAAILLPTDAALGQPILSNPDVPESPRRALTVESGLNDGMALPLVLIAAAMAAPMAQAPAEGWTLFTLKQIILGPLVGIALGCVGGWCLIAAQKRNWTSDIYEGVGALALAALSYLCAVQIGGNGFISAFVAGFCFGIVIKGHCKFIYEFTESEGQILSWTAFFLVGAVLLPDAILMLTPAILAMILLSLFVLRPASIALSLVNTDADTNSRVFLGWFGARGLATVLFATLVAPVLDADLASWVISIAANTVWISALLHGVTAYPGGQIYARLAQAKSAQSP